MPHRLIKQINYFCSLPDIKTRKKSNGVFLVDIIDISDEACNTLDKIADTIEDIWRGPKPNPEIMRVMAANAYPITAGIIELGVWMTSHIVTPYGRIKI